MDDIIGDQEGDYSYSGSYGDPTKLFDYDFSNLFDSFGGVDLSNINLSNIIGDQVGDYPTTLSDLKTWDDILGNEDALKAFTEKFGDQPGDFPTTKSELESWNAILGNEEALAEILGTKGDQPGDYSTSGYVGSATAPGVYDAVQELFKENANVAAGNFPGTSGASGLTTNPLTKLLSGKDTNTLKEIIHNLTGGKDNAALLAALLGGLLGLANKSGGAGAGRVTGFQGGQGKPLTATRQALSPTGAPGAGGKRFMTDVTYAADGGLMSLYDMNTPVAMMASGGVADVGEYLNMGHGLNAGDLRKADYLVRGGASPEDASKYYSQVQDGMAKGGLSNLGSYSDGGRMLKGPGDGMSDSIPATIGGKREARLADGEFVVPADVVSHLGNGSTDAGADVLYGMMDKVRKARTGTKKQGKQINPGKFVPRN